MFKHTQTICLSGFDHLNCLRGFDRFVGLMLKGLKNKMLDIEIKHRKDERQKKF